MKWLWKMIFPARRVLGGVASRINFRQSGLLKLRSDVRACEYEDVRVMWEMLKINETEGVRTDGSRKKRIWSFLQCATSAQCLDASTTGCLSAAFPRKTLKENGFSQGATEDGDPGSMHLNDYDPVDPAPNYETSIKPGPIEHGSPVIPHIPKPSPPDRPKVGGIS